MPSPNSALLESHDDRIVRVEEKVEGLLAAQARFNLAQDNCAKAVEKIQDTLDNDLLTAIEDGATKQREAFEAVDRRLKVLEDHHVQKLATRAKIRTALGGALLAALGAIGTAFGADFATWLKAFWG